MEQNQQLIDNTITYARLPRTLPVKDLDCQYKKVAGYFKLGSFTRLNEFLLNENNDLATEVYVEIEFALLDKNKIIVNGQVNQEVTMTCQRCLEAMQYCINSKISVVLIDALSRMDEKLVEYEPILLDGSDLLDLHQLVEDELILSLPVAVKHDERQFSWCNSSIYLI